MEAKVLERWLALSKRLGVGDKIARDIYHTIIAYRYMEPGRAYHTLAHITRGLKELDNVRGLAQDPNQLELDWFFHDAIYDTWSDDSEYRSGKLALFVITKLMGLPELKGIRSFHRIWKTDHKHDTGVIVGDDKLMLDIDLHELGRPWPEFCANSKNVRREFYWVPEEIYRRKRIEIFESFLARIDIYFTQYFRDKYEQQARENLTQEIARLRLQ